MSRAPCVAHGRLLDLIRPAKESWWRHPILRLREGVAAPFLRPVTAKLLTGRITEMRRHYEA